MSITSLQFLAFCIATVLLFIIFPRKYRWVSLLISSIAFYLISAKVLILFMLFTAFTIYMSCLMMDKVRLNGEKLLEAETEKEAKKQIKNKVAKKRKLILVIAILINIGILVCFKIFNYFSGAFTAVLGLFMGSGERVDTISLVLPLGISYYTFATVGYMLDVYWKRYEVEKNFFRFFLFTSYYPHILQGPISRYNLLGKELKKEKLYFTWNNFVCGMESILLGLFKKLVIADRASLFVAQTLREPGLHGSIYLLAMILDAIQIYTDFSGYMDIVSGISRMFDVKLEQNFNHPFMAKSVPEFWRRWHMSLGSWFKDYVYYPVSVSRPVKKLNKKVKNWKSPHLKNMVIVLFPVMITWLLTGLWHGTGKGYVMWGIYYGTLILLSVTFSEDIVKLVKKIGINTECFSYRVFQTIKMFCIFMGGRFLGTTMGFAYRKAFIKSILFNFQDFAIFDYKLDMANFVILIIGVIFLLIIAAIEAKEDIFSWFNRQNKVFCAIILYILIFTVFLLGIYGNKFDTSNFMYQIF